MEQIQLSGVTKSFGKAVAVRQLDLTIRPGEFLTILGPSGCGKTTTLRAIAGLDEPDGGEIKLGEKVVFSRRDGIIIPPEQRGLGLIFQSYALWPHMTVERNITLALKEKRLGAALIEERLTTALDMVQLTPYRARYPSELSGGQQQRVAVARLIAMRPSVLLMDEPLSNLDAKLRHEMRAELKRLHRDLEATTVYVTHDQVEALTLSDRVIVMSDGAVMQDGSPYDIYHHPMNLFVAEFIGDPQINLIRGAVSGGPSGMRLDCGDLQLPVAPELAQEGRRLVASARPESISASTTPRDGWLQVRLDNVQPTGAQTILQVHAGKTPLTVLQPGFITLEFGAPLWIDFDPEALNFFDPDSGENLADQAAGAGQRRTGT